MTGLVDRLRLAAKRFAYNGIGRDRWQEPDAIVTALGLRDGHRVADLGSGTGYFTQRLARAVTPGGVVFAVDTDRQLLDEVERVASRAGLANVVAVPAGNDGVTLPEPVDLVFISHVYHHLPDPSAYLARLGTSLRPGGRVAILEGRATNRLTRWFGHVTEPDVVRREMAAAGYRLAEELPSRPRESFQVFELVPPA